MRSSTLGATQTLLLVLSENPSQVSPNPFKLLLLLQKHHKNSSKTVLSEASSAEKYPSQKQSLQHAVIKLHPDSRSTEFHSKYSKGSPMYNPISNTAFTKSVRTWQPPPGILGEMFGVPVQGFSGRWCPWFWWVHPLPAVLGSGHPSPASPAGSSSTHSTQTNPQTPDFSLILISVQFQQLLPHYLGLGRQSGLPQLWIVFL